MSKLTSEFILRLQKNEFQWKDDTFDNLYKKYPKCKSALEWWCNTKGNGSSFNISRNKLLKEFMIENPPTFHISNKCCDFAKKKVSHSLIENGNYDLNIIGIRKAEGGIRSSTYKKCFDDNEGDGCDNYRSIFWYSDQDKVDYENAYHIKHSKCYTEYGLKRTGCAGCPYGRDFEFELEVVKQHETKLYKAVTNVFKDSYEYTRKYREFRKEIELKRE